MSLFTDSELAALRAVAELSMTTPVTIRRQSITTTANGTEAIWTEVGSVLGNLFSEPSPTIGVVAGAMGLVNTYRLFVPLDTDILSGDEAVINSLVYTVSDTTADTTWRALLRCSLRLVE